MKVSRLTRLIELLMLLQSGRGHNSKHLAETCGVSRRTIFRDLDVLRQAGVPLQFDDEHQRFFLPDGNLLPPTSFTTEEALCLMLLCHELGGQRGLPFLGAAHNAAVKLESSLPQPIREHLHQVAPAIEIDLAPRNRLTSSQPFYRRMVDAIARRRCVRIRYGSLAENATICTKLQPYRMLFNNRSWYVIGRSSLHRGTRTFNMGRILQLDLLDEAYRIPSGFTLQRYLRNAWRMIPEPGKDQDVQIRFQPQVAKNVAEVVWHKTQHVRFNDDGTLDFFARVSGIREIAWWVLGYGDQAEVIKPAALRQLVAGHCRRMAERYADRAKRPTNGRVRKRRPPPKRD